MKIHEYQAKELLRAAGLAVPQGRYCSTSAEVKAAYEELETELCVVKAQIHAGGRGKAGGVKLVRSAAEAEEAADSMFGVKLVTHQTGPGGQEVRRIWIEEGSAIASEYYIGIVVDRETQEPVMMASSEGGMEIETVAAETPDLILKAAYSPDAGLDEAEALRLAAGIGIPEALLDEAAVFLVGLAKLFCEKDCSLAEINPLATTEGGGVIALDAKINFDSSALFRHEELGPLRDLDEEDAKEIEASRFDLNYIALDGSIGCMVNGAGLAMASMDVIQLHGGSPANFLDVGGGATKENVTAAFRILLSDEKVKAVLVNIFGGIMKCDVIASGIVAAVKEVDLNVPLVVRLEGTNVEAGRQILASSGLPIDAAESLDEAAAMACAAIGVGGEA